ncbi:DUF305 domain-containing protein [Caballeronia sp. SEWSISQ10-4 2]|uniref:DUF305 domain-containing protein n=1 Tax=Caballeronia sp. SEWSISQ10-4 2 TaxID=2937438 RepID=UPI002652703F|nr:DUF305 domain-containing protein [Caballeronia sp. SEWSISQ10-4 2]MDN7181421.1 DUF305 domain-containing protein [Caballeronia sp. SEWSISQ10-4 2]
MSSNFITALRARCMAAVAISAVAIAFVSTGSSARAADTASGGPEAPFLTENDQAMTRMMDGMSVKPSGDVDRDFVAMMIPHHQGAIDMAQAELRYGHNEQLRRIAQEIIVEQQQEITAMRVALGQPLPPSAPVPDQEQTPEKAAPSQPMSSMTTPMPMRMDQETQ